MYGKLNSKKKCRMVGGSSLAKEKVRQIKIEKEMPYGSTTCHRLGEKYGKIYWLRKCHTSASVGFVTRRVRAVREVVGPTVYE